MYPCAWPLERASHCSNTFTQVSPVLFLCKLLRLVSSFLSISLSLSLSFSLSLSPTFFLCVFIGGQFSPFTLASPLAFGCSVE